MRDSHHCIVKHPFHTFLGIDLGGARGKTTAVARLVLPAAPARGVAVAEVSIRARDADGSEEPWNDEALLEYVRRHRDAGPLVLAVNAPLTVPACVRCREAVCPGQEQCSVPAVQWMQSEGAAIVEQAALSDRDRIAVIPRARGGAAPRTRLPPVTLPRLVPYSHRATEIALHYQRGLLPRGCLGMSTGPVAARAIHLRRILAQLGLRLNHDLLEVSPRATVRALFGAALARGYKRDADPWATRACLVDQLEDLRFALTSRLSKEEVLQSDHCFEALLSAYTAYLWARDGWSMPDSDVFEADGWIWVPPASRRSP